MTPEMSEFSYGFALTNELIHRHDVALTGAPRFPTQREEGRVGGYDVALPRQGLPLFLQFKRCECLVRRNANEAAALGLPYFRMWLMARRHSDQHDLLLDLEGQGNEVYYAAPRFHLMAELNDAYLAGRVASLTSFIAPSWVGVLPDDDSHYVAIRRDDASRLLCSKEPRKIEVMSSEAVLGERVRKAARERGTVIDEGYLRGLGDALVEQYVKARPVERERERVKAEEVKLERSGAEYAREVANLLYGCELFIALSD